MSKSPEDMAESMIRNLAEKTGKSLEQWLVISHATGLNKHGLLTKHLKSEYGITDGYANLIAHKTLRSDAGSAAGDKDLVDAQYAGPKSELRPIYDALIGAIATFGKDLEIAPKKAYVSLRRNKQFGLIQPSTRTRVDVGLNLKGTPTGNRLEASGSFNAMVSHRVRVSAVTEVNDELVAWLKAAYNAA